MAVLPIVTHPHPVLEQRCAEVEAFDAELARLLDDMADTMREADGVGLAAPQVGKPVRVAIVEALGQDGEPEILELVNPVITHRAGAEVEIEGCLSFPDLFGEVERPFQVRVEAQERDGSLFELEAEGFDARAIEHEVDHLDGVLFTSKLLRRLTQREMELEMERRVEREEESE